MKYTLEKYKQNLFVSNDYIYSYNTKVAYIDHFVRKVFKLGYWSQTTTKHTNYVANEMNYDVIEKPIERSKVDG